MLRRPLVLGGLRAGLRSMHAALTPVPTADGLKIVTSLSGASYGICDPAALQKVLDDVLSRDAFLRDVETAQGAIASMKKELEPLEALEGDIERRCSAHASRVLSCIGAAMAVQFAVLFNWVFFVFDWNLVEPVTYFLGYTVIWWSLMFYNRTGKDFSYEGILDELKSRKHAKLCKSMGLNASKLTELRSEIEVLEKKLHDIK